MDVLNIVKVAFALLTLVLLFVFTRNLFALMLGNEHDSAHKKRLKQLKFQTKRESSDADETRELINKLTGPMVNHVMPRFKNLGDMSKMERDLEMSQWNKYFTPTTFVATDLTLKALACVIGAILIPLAWQMGAIWFGALFFAFRMLHSNSRNERRFRLLSQFPEFIRITQGFLMSNLPLSQAIEQSLPYVGEEWRPLLQEFVINSEVYSLNECIDILSNKVDIFEVRELWSLIKLNAEQGIDVKDSFNNQAEKVKEMQLEVMMGKIGKRQTMGMIIQGPLLLTMILSFGLPTFKSMMTGFGI